jgi:hypothetical protein
VPRDDDALFIELWSQGLPGGDIAARLGIPRGTVKSRARRLQLEGKIEPRARGGRPSTVARIDVSAPATPAIPAIPAPPAVTFVAVPEIQEILSIIKDLQARVDSLEQPRVPPAPPAMPVPPAPPAPERSHVRQWTLRLSNSLIEHMKAVAYERRIPPSQLVEELLWAALRGNDRSP